MADVSQQTKQNEHVSLTVQSNSQLVGFLLLFFFLENSEALCSKTATRWNDLNPRDLDGGL